jgi:hypothetical protein
MLGVDSFDLRLNGFYARDHGEVSAFEDEQRRLD